MADRMPRKVDTVDGMLGRLEYCSKKVSPFAGAFPALD